MLVGASAERLDGVHPSLVKVFNEVAKFWDINIIEGKRTVERQRQLFNAKKSRTMDSKHIVQANGFVMAVDAGPDPLDWRDINRFYYFGGVVLAIAHSLGIRIRWGGDWNGNTQIQDQRFNDLVHFELVE